MRACVCVCTSENKYGGKVISRRLTEKMTCCATESANIRHIYTDTRFDECSITLRECVYTEDYSRNVILFENVIIRIYLFTVYSG